MFGYTKWDSFKNAIGKAKTACENAGVSPVDHFVDVNKMVKLGSGSERSVEDIALTRCACCLIAQNGDPSKSEIAFAQTCFAVQTRRQEIIEKRLLDVDRVTAREKLTRTGKELSGILCERGVKPESPRPPKV